MNRKNLIWMGVLFLSIFVFALVVESADQKIEKKKFVLKLYKDLNFTTTKNKYVGARKCKVCHKNKDKGQQYKKWRHSRHAKAFKTLKKKLAKEIGKKYGIADPQKDPRCLQCHVTAYKIPDKLWVKEFRKYRIKDGVACETCHGAGVEFSSDENIMKDLKLAKSKGLIKPVPKDCTRCHNKDRQPPETYERLWGKKPYNFKKMFKTMKHYRPGKKATKAWK